MIIFGTGKRRIQDGELKFDCRYCGSERSVGLDFYVRYFHIFWIPMFSYRVEALSHCAHCRQALVKREMPSDLSTNIAKEKPRVPWKYFSGLLLGAVMILFIFVAIANENWQTQKYLKDPNRGDVYAMKQTNGYYTLYLLSELKADSLGFRINDYEVPSSSKLSVIRRDHADDYGKDLIFLSKADVAELLKKKYVVNIRRD